MKRMLGIMLMGFLVFAGACQKMERPVMNSIPDEEENDGAIRILAIGNSFSEDALEDYLYDLAETEGVPVIIGNLYIGGASLEEHVKNINENNKAYSYRKIDKSGEKETKASTSIAEALADENWTHISFQQVSQLSGLYDTWEKYLPDLYAYVAPRAQPDTKFVLHQTWAYAENSTHEGFANYDNDQMQMYEAIVSAVEKAKDLVEIDDIVPSGTAIQNGRTSVISDNFTRDGYHLDMNIGRFTAACTWYEYLTGKDVTENTFKPKSLSDYEADIAKNAAHSAMQVNDAVTDMVDFKDWGGTFVFEQPARISFQYSDPVDGWDGFSSHLAGSSILNLKDVEGDFTGVTLTIMERFNGVNGDGVLGGDVFGMPDEIAKSSFFGNSKGEFSDMLIEKSVVKISGLEAGKKYSFCFFGSRGGVTDNREAAYILDGDSTHEVFLDASSNKDKTVCAPEVMSDENGEIVLTVTAGPNNTNGTGFYYITAMQITPE